MQACFIPSVIVSDDAKDIASIVSVEVVGEIVVEVVSEVSVGNSKPNVGVIWSSLIYRSIFKT